MKDTKKCYCYLVIRKADGKKFLAYGNFKFAWQRPSALYEFVTEDYECAYESPYGLRCNISSENRYNSAHYSVIHQTAIPRY